MAMREAIKQVLVDMKVLNLGGVRSVLRRILTRRESSSGSGVVFLNCVIKV
jgi:hypothetical protein